MNEYIHFAQHAGDYSMFAFGIVALVGYAIWKW